MDIVIGSTPPVGPPPPKGPGGEGVIEARILNIRAPRRRRGTPPPGQKDRREQKGRLDPVGGRVMVILIPEGYRIPKDIESGDYRLFVRFAPRKR